MLKVPFKDKVDLCVLSFLVDSVLVYIVVSLSCSASLSFLGLQQASSSPLLPNSHHPGIMSAPDSFKSFKYEDTFLTVHMLHTQTHTEMWEGDGRGRVEGRGNGEREREREREPVSQVLQATDFTASGNLIRSEVRDKDSCPEVNVGNHHRPGDLPDM